MTAMDTVSVRLEGASDCDGHILEPPDLWGDAGWCPPSLPNNDRRGD